MKLLGVLIGFAIAFTAVAQEVGSVPEYRRDSAATRTLVAGAVSIRTGDAKASVLAKLGTPDRDRTLMRKERPEVVGRSMTYDIVKWKRGFVNELHDQYVDVFLDASDVVKSVTIRAELVGK